MSVIKQTFVINDSSGLAANLSEILAGQLGFVQDGTVSATLTAGDTGVQFAIRNQTSITVNTGELKRVYKAAFSAGTAQVSTVNITAANPLGPKYVKIIDTSYNSQPNTKQTFEGTAAEIAAQINDASDFLSGFSATAAGEVVTVTAPKNKVFKLASYAEATIAYTGGATAKMAPTVGTPADVAVYESGARPYEGIKITHDFPIVAPASQVVAANDYDLVFADFIMPRSSKARQGATFNEEISFVFACKADVNALADALVTELSKLA